MNEEHESRPDGGEGPSRARTGPPDDAPAKSVLAAVDRVTGEAPRVVLRDHPFEEGAEPVIDPASSEKSQVPEGRGNYQILGEIAQGGMGIVLKGHDTDLGRDVAMKVLHARLAEEPVLLQRFIEEAQIGGQLQHPGIVPVYELGLMADQRPYFTMKLVKGRNLGSMLKKRRSPDDDRRRFLGIFEQVCQTIAYAHSRGVIHRDIKPDNIMVGAFGEVQVVDWGLAKVLDRASKTAAAREKLSQISIIETVRSRPDSDGSDSMAGSVMGTPAYMPPEQATGDVDKMDERSDVFSLGATLCEILTGKPPYAGEHGTALEMAAHAQLDEARERLDACGADTELVQLATDCLMPAREVRPGDASVVAETLHEHLVSVEERAREARIRAEQERKARLLTLALAATVLIAVVGGGGGWVWIERGRADRIARTDSEAVAALNEASLLRGQERWQEARTAAARAVAVLDAGDASEETERRVRSQFADIDAEAFAAAHREELALGNARLLGAFEEIRQEEGDELGAPDWDHIDGHYDEVFADVGLRLDEQHDDEAVRILRDRGIDADVAVALDAWAAVKRRTEDGAADAERLVALARHLDDDPLRVKLRTAVAERLRTVLVDIARSIVPSEVPGSTLSLLGSSLERVGANEEALDVYRRGQRAHRGDFALTFSLAQALRRSKPPRNEEAFRFYTAALALRPESMETLHRMGLLCKEEFDRQEDAVAIFREALGIAGEDSHLYRHLGQALRKAGRIDLALDAFGRSIELGPTDEGPYRDRGGLWLDEGELDKALADFEKALEISPNQSGTRRRLADAYYTTGDLEKAIAGFRETLRRNPLDAVAHGQLLLALFFAGRYEDVYEEYDRGREVLVDDASFHATMALFLAFCPDPFYAHTERAVELAQRAVEMEPESGYTRSWLAGALLMDGRPREALEIYERLLEDSEEPDPSDLFVLTMIHVRLENREHSNRYFWRGMQAMQLPKWRRVPLFVFLRDAAAVELGIESPELLERK